jgi:hypothetical protein
MSDATAMQSDRAACQGLDANLACRSSGRLGVGAMSSRMWQRSIYRPAVAADFRAMPGVTPITRLKVRLKAASDV